MRVSNWQTRLGAYVESCRTRVFAYGAFDCTLFVADAVREMTGLDIAAQFRDGYSSEFGALRLIAQYGTLGNLMDEAMALHRFPEVSGRQARRGDPVLLRRETGHSLGIVSLYGADILAPGDIGLLRYPMSLAERAWRI